MSSKPPRRRVGPALRVSGATATAAASLLGCGGGHAAGPTGPATSAGPTRVITVAPASGPIGTVFALSIAGLTRGQPVQFEITFPASEKAYPGGTLTAGDDGTASASYRATATNPPGDYSVRVSGASGTVGSGSFTVTSGAPITSAVARSTTTSKASSVTTKKSGATATTKAGATTTKPAGTSSTTKAVPTATTAPSTTRATITTPPT